MPWNRISNTRAAAPDSAPFGLSVGTNTPRPVFTLTIRFLIVNR